MRQRLGQGRRTDILSQKMPAELHDRLIEACDRFNRSKSEIVRAALSAYLNSLENQNPAA